MKAVLWALVFLGLCLVHWGHWQPSLRCSLLSDSRLRQHRQNYECWTVCFTDSEILTGTLDNPAVLNDNIYIWLYLRCQTRIRCLKVTVYKHPNTFSSPPFLFYFSIHVDSFKTKCILKSCMLAFRKNKKFGVLWNVKIRLWSSLKVFLLIHCYSVCLFFFLSFFNFEMYLFKTYPGVVDRRISISNIWKITQAFSLPKL